jgi:hypothetical protein
MLKASFFMEMTAIILGQAGQSTAQTFYRQFLCAGGPIVWFVLLPMSVVTVYLAMDLLMSTRRKRLLPAGIGHGDCHAGGPARAGRCLLTKLAGRRT